MSSELTCSLHVIKWQLPYLVNIQVLINDEELVLRYVTFCRDYGLSVMVIVSTRNDIDRLRPSRATPLFL